MTYRGRCEGRRASRRYLLGRGLVLAVLRAAEWEAREREARERLEAMLREQLPEGSKVRFVDDAWTFEIMLPVQLVDIPVSFTFRNGLGVDGVPANDGPLRGSPGALLISVDDTPGVTRVEALDDAEEGRIGL